MVQGSRGASQPLPQLPMSPSFGEWKAAALLREADPWRRLQSAASLKEKLKIGLKGIVRVVWVLQCGRGAPRRLSLSKSGSFFKAIQALKLHAGRVVFSSKGFEVVFSAPPITEKKAVIAET